jgi:ABC-type branched-subunit amino acid transport system substrate-binding protein
VRARLTALHVTVLDEVSVDPRSDFGTVVEASLRRGVPDAVVSAARWVETAAIAGLVRRARPGIHVVAGDGALLLPELARLAGEAGPAVRVVTFWMPDSPDSTSQAFVERFQRVIGREPVGSQAMTHDAIMVLATAAQAAGPNPGRIRRYLEDLGRTRPPYHGVTGPISFQPGRPANLIMTRLEGDRVVRADRP